MVFLNTLSRHSEWRKLAKKLRRKRIRQTRARERDSRLLADRQRIENLPHYKKWLREQDKIEEEQTREEGIQAAQREEQWIKVEQDAQRQWQVVQRKIALAREEKAKQNMKIKFEWEKEQQRLKEIEIAKEKELEEKRAQQEKREKELLDFLEQGGDTPEHLKTKMETNPGKQECPFFTKVSACRFFDVCSRNHIRPGISRTLLISNFFSDMSLEIKENEHGSDSSLEFEKEDTYKNFKEFFNDVVLEFKKCGTIKRFFTCCNHEAHLRGNVYVQYLSTRDALVAYHKFNGRWYAGKQLNVEFCSIANWGHAICGMFFKKKCPKGNSCNFLHLFRNPGGIYFHPERDSSYPSLRNSPENRGRSSFRRRDDFEHSWDRNCSERKNWRWSESPERPPKYSSDDGNNHRDRRNSRRNRNRDDKEDGRSRGSRLSSRRSRRKRSRSNSRRKSRSREDKARKRRSRSRSASRRSRGSPSQRTTKSSSESSEDSSTD